MSAAVAVQKLSIGWGDVPLIEGITFEVAPGRDLRDPRRQRLWQVDAASLPHRTRETASRVTSTSLAAARRISTRGLPPFGVMFQQGALFGSMTVLENVALPLEEWTSLEVAPGRT